MFRESPDGVMAIRTVVWNGPGSCVVEIVVAHDGGAPLIERRVSQRLSVVPEKSELS